MSLINDALKKAQKQREIPTGTPPPGVPPPQSPVAPASSPAPRGNNFTLLIAAAAVLVSGSVAATVYFLRTPAPAPREVAAIPTKAAPTMPAAPVVAPSPAPATTSAVVAAPPPKSSAPATTPTPVSAPAPSPAAAPAHSAPAPSVSFSAPTTAPTAGAVPPASTAATATVAAPPAAAIEPLPRPPAPEAPVLKATYRIQGMIDKFRISGIRMSDTENKVILNDHLFRTNDLVEASLGLRLTKIEPHLLTFTDSEGNVYLKHF